MFFPISFLLCLMPFTLAIQHGSSIVDDTFLWISSLLPSSQKTIWSDENTLKLQVNKTSPPVPLVKSEDSAWTLLPKCYSNIEMNEPVCLFSSNSFARGRGISILTTHDQASTFLSLPAFTDPHSLPDVNIQTQPPYEERSIAGRGRGLIANMTLHRGDRIFSYTPVLIIDSAAYDLLEEQRLELSRDAVDQLPPNAKKEFRKLHGHFGTEAVDDRINTNSFDIEVEGTSLFAVFPEISVSISDQPPYSSHPSSNLLPAPEPRLPPQRRLLLLFHDSDSPRSRSDRHLPGHRTYHHIHQCSYLARFSSCTTF